jgi:hypothetical protein
VIFAQLCGAKMGLKTFIVTIDGERYTVLAKDRKSVKAFLDDLVSKDGADLVSIEQSSDDTIIDYVLAIATVAAAIIIFVLIT